MKATDLDDGLRRQRRELEAGAVRGCERELAQLDVIPGYNTVGSSAVLLTVLALLIVASRVKQMRARHAAH